MKSQSATHSLSGMEIAVIGMAGRFPGANNLEVFWRNVRDGIESVSVLSEPELLAAGVDPKLLRDHRYVRARAVLEDIDLFDAAFFGFTPREAELLDPQQRLFLESAWEALEHAGYSSDLYDGAIGVYGGASLSGYLFNLMPERHLLQSASDMAAVLAADKDFLATRVSYKLDLEGPSLTVQTACSTSLVAVHLACQGLLSGECDMALAGGVSISVPQTVGYLYQEGGIASPDGHCRTFDVKAQGTVGGSGVGVVVLKRVNDALADGDRIVALIKGSAVNNDGAKKVGYTAPRIEGQAKVIMAAQALAAVDPRSIGYVEAHGTATPMGDPIEIAALTHAFRSQTDDRQFCAIGSVKTNIGHLDAAAGIAGLIKAALALEHRLIPPSLHFTQPNPQINFGASPFYVNRVPTEWKAAGEPRRAGVSSFGIGGTNAHVVLEEAPEQEPSGPTRSWQLLAWSAKTPSALETMTDRLAAHLHEHSKGSLADAAFTLQVGRKAFPHRRLLVCQTREEAVEMLEGSRRHQMLTGGPVTSEPAVVFMFSGQGAQYVNMGRELYDTEAIFREQVDHCVHLLRPELGLDLRQILYPAKGQADAAQQQLDQTAMTQPALFVIAYALARLWMSWGVRPHAMIGHSLGEYVAACLAGVFSLSDALTLVTVRGRLMQQQPRGAMLAVPLSEDQVVPHLREGLSLAAVNAPTQCVVSGLSEDIEQLERTLAERGIEGRRLQTSHAFHSGMMDPILDPFEHRLRAMTRRAPQIPYVSNVTGTWITAAEIDDPHYWSRHLRETVRFAAGVRTLRGQSDCVLLEVGPGQTLATLAAQGCDGPTDVKPLSSLRRPRTTTPRGSETACLLNTLGNLWLTGVSVDWFGLHAGERRRRVPLPPYPFERRRYWLTRQPQDSEGLRSPSGRKPDIADWFYVPSWKRSVPPLERSTNDRGPSSWLVLLDDGLVGQDLVSRLERDGHMVTTVAIGERFQRIGDGAYSIQPGHRDDYDALRQELARLGRHPDVIVHCWSLSEETRPPAAVFECVQERGFYSLLFLAQAFAGHRRLAIIALSNGVHGVTGQEVLRPEKATLLGACRVIPQEYPDVRCRNVDIELGSSRVDTMATLTDRILIEAGVETAESTVAYRGAHRWAEVFEPIKLERVEQRPLLLRQHGVYLLTGGLGGVGLVLAEYLARTVQARLVLTSRSEPTPEQRQRVDELERLGADVLVMSADAADIVAMQAVVDSARERFGEIHGVIHAAGIPGGGMIDLKTLAAVREELAPKAIGALVLDDLFKEQRLDFLAFCSSLNAVTGGFGQVGYCAANAFLDALAHFRAAARSTYTLSINSDRWRQVGMAIDAELRLKSLGIEESDRGMTANEGQEVFHRLLGQATLPQVLISTRMFPSPVEDSEAQLAATALKAGQRFAGSERRHPRPSSVGVYVAPATAVEEQLAAIWEQVFGIDGIGTQDNFFALGGESLLALQIVNRIRDAFRVEVPVRQFYENSSIAGVASIIEAARDNGPPVVDAIVPCPRESLRPAGPARDAMTLSVEGSSR